MIRKNTIERIILKMTGHFTAKDILEQNKLLFSRSYTIKKSLNYLTVVLHSLWKSDQIKKVSRGVFTTDSNFVQVDMKDWNSMIKYYCQNDNGFVSKEFLWMKKGMTDEWPAKLVIYTNLVIRTKKTGNIEIRPTKIAIDATTKPIFELYELVQLADLTNSNHIEGIRNHIKQNNIKKVNIDSYKGFFKRRYAKLVKMEVI